MRRKSAYESETRDIWVRVTPTYLDGESAPDEGRWVWAYHIEIENRGAVEVQLLARRWVITDARGQVEEVRGPGVVGEQPVIAPGETFAYASGCPLPTSSGAMQGAYRMVDETGEGFDVVIPAFSLDVPGARRVLN